MREGSHQHSPSHRAARHAVDGTLDPGGSDGGSGALDLIAKFVLKVR
jgi:Asp-tRNA(Asn)/Glu-tRNA(Gln) amidotransferase A subunit family amidase